MSAYYGERHHKAKFSDEVVRAIRESTEPMRELVRRFGVSKSQVDRIRARRQTRR